MDLSTAGERVITAARAYGEALALNRKSQNRKHQELLLAVRDYETVDLALAEYRCPDYVEQGYCGAYVFDYHHRKVVGLCRGPSGHSDAHSDLYPLDGRKS